MAEYANYFESFLFIYLSHKTKNTFNGRGEIENSIHFQTHSVTCYKFAKKSSENKDLASKVIKNKNRRLKSIYMFTQILKT